MAENNLIVYKVQVDTASGKIAIEGLTKGFVNADRAVKKLKVEVDALKTATDGLGTSSGIAGAFINELGRTISDAPYGIQAISNNISQLGSLFAIMVVSAGNLKRAFESLIATLKASPILVALLAFQAITAVVTSLSKRAEKAAESMGSIAKAGADTTAALITAQKALDKENVSMKEKQEIIASINKEYPELNASLDENGRLTKESTDRINDKITSLKNLAKAQAILKLIEEQYANIAIAESKAADESASFGDKTRAVISGLSEFSIGAYNRTLSFYGGKTKNATIQASKDLIADLEKQLEDGGLIDQLMGTSKTQTEKRERAFRKNLLDFSNEVERFNRAGEEKAIEFDEEKLAREGRYQQRALRNEYELFLAKEKLRVMAALASAKTDKERADIQKSWQEMQVQALQEYNEATYALSDSTANREVILEEKKQARIRQIIMQGMSDEAAFKVQMATNDFNRIAGELDAQKIAHETRMALLEEERQARINAGYETSEIDAKITDEKNSNAYATTKLQNKLELSKLAVINQVGQAAVDIAGEGSAIGKAVSIAMAIINTREAITAALGSKPYGPWNIAQAVAVGAAGFAQVRGIMSQQLPVAAKGGTGGTPSVQAPDFNIVGANQTNQLASAIQGQFNNPIKAYVVSKDVSTAQELDRNVVNAASIG